jgi:ABC-type sugar transport system ATPase subunit
MQEILEMVNITKYFGVVAALKNVSIDMGIGEVLALVGENGAGKSTLMKVLSGHYPHGTFEGEIRINGQHRIFKNTRDSKNAGIEMIYQEISLHLDLSVAENVYLGNLPSIGRYFLDRTRLNNEAKSYLELVGLEVRPDEMVRKLSTSQQQLLSIARALSRKPEILVLDEPTSALTQLDAQNLLRIIKSLKQNGISIIYISHKLEEVYEIADRIIVLRDGCCISNNLNKDILPDKIIEDMVGRKIYTLYPKENVTLGEEILKVENITVPHPFMLQKNIVEDISFNLHKGEILGIAGLVGSGRSELVNAIFGSNLKTSGKVYKGNREIKIKQPSDAIKKGIGLVTEDRKKSGIVSAMSLKENMTMVILRRISKAGVIARKEELAISEKFFNMFKVKARGINDNIMSLSGGNQQKVVLAKWLMANVDVLILDEPTRGIDVGAKVEIYSLMTELARNGIGIIMISSELPELIGMCDRFIVLSRGRINGQFSKDEISQEKIMRAATGLQRF